MSFNQPTVLRRKHQFAFLLSELIGEQVSVASSGCKGVQGLNGLIVDETVNTFVIESRGVRKKIPKKTSEFFFPVFNARVKGIDLIGRPEDRTKKLFHKLTRKQ